jgi:hypothetical protein
MRKNISLSDSVDSMAQELIKSGVADGLSDLCARLIRDEWDRRHGPAPQNQTTLLEEKLLELLLLKNKERKK